MDRVIAICPTFWTQPCFEPMYEDLDHERDVFTKPTEETFREIKRQIFATYEYTTKNKLKPIRTLIFMDDLAGLGIFHGGRISEFANLAIQSRHHNVSIIAISQQATAITPAFRDNCFSVLCFPSGREADKTFIKKEYQSIHYNSKTMDEIIETAWKDSNFLFILANPRSEIRYFIDFYQEIKPF